MEFPKDPLTSAEETSAILHEMYQSMVTAGFSEEQATYFIGEILKAAFAGGPKQ